MAGLRDARSVAVVGLVLFAVIIGMTAAFAQATQLTDAEVCDLTPRDGSWSQGVASTDNLLSVVLVTTSGDLDRFEVSLAGATAACSNRFEYHDGTGFEVAVYQFPSEAEARAAMEALRLSASGLAAVDLFSGAARETLGDAAWLAPFEFDQLAFAQAGPFLVGAHSNEAYDYNRAEYTDVLVERMSTALGNLAQDTGPAPDVGSASEAGVILIGDLVFINSPPGGTINITRDDLPNWAADLLVTVGDIYARVGPPGTISGGDNQVLLDGVPIARLGDPTSMGGTIMEGSTLIYINGEPAATFGSMVLDPLMTGPLVPGIGGPIVRGDCDPDRRVNHMGQSICTDSGVAALEQATRRGDVRIVLDGDGEFQIGDGLIIGDDEETADTALVIDKGSLILDRPLQYDHAAGSALIRIPAEYVDQVLAQPETLGADARELSDDGAPTGVIVMVGLVVAAIGVLGYRRKTPDPQEPPPPPPPPGS